MCVTWNKRAPNWINGDEWNAWAPLSFRTHRSSPRIFISPWLDIYVLLQNSALVKLRLHADHQNFEGARWSAFSESVIKFGNFWLFRRISFAKKVLFNFCILLVKSRFWYIGNFSSVIYFGTSFIFIKNLPTILLYLSSLKIIQIGCKK